jgi:hypothetical protein
MKAVIIFSFVTLFLIVGCSQVPRPTTFEFTTQQQLQSATHWRVIARTTAARINSAMMGQGFVEKDNSTPAIYISNADTSPFGVAVRNYLITELMNINSSLRISNNPDSPIIVSWDSQLISRAPFRPRPFLGVPVAIVEYAGTILVGGGWNTSDFGVTHTEVILTTNIQVRDHVMARYSDTFFINDGDCENYEGTTVVNGVHPRSIAAKDQAWRAKLAKKGLLAEK